MQDKPDRCGYVAIVGAPNAGKSTLLNRVVGTKLAIVTPKAQTTRNRILGITLRENAQIIFVDTPGIFRAKEKFERAMVESALVGARDADMVLLVVDAVRGITRTVENVLARLKHVSAPTHLVLNKVDKASKAELLALTKALCDIMNFEGVFMLSALTGDGVEDLLKMVANGMPEGHWLYPEDQFTDLSERFIAAEVTRERLFMRLQQELPYQIAVETETWEERKDGSVKIQQVIYVRTDAHKKIVIGNRGEMLKEIGASAREQLERLQNRRVHLFLFVKVSENWKDNREFYDALGLDY
ncbi:MAG: GTPase Era [Rickettsiales bacterium]|nr:GTPase Era [Rickettsiales bacterium]